MNTVDMTGALVSIKENGIVKLDGITIFRKVERDGKLFLQFVDSDRMRVQCRGSRYIEIPLDILVATVQKEDDNEQITRSPYE